MDNNNLLKHIYFDNKLLNVSLTSNIKKKEYILKYYGILKLRFGKKIYKVGYLQNKYYRVVKNNTKSIVDKINGKFYIMVLIYSSTECKLTMKPYIKNFYKKIDFQY